MDIVLNEFYKVYLPARWGGVAWGGFLSALQLLLDKPSPENADTLNGYLHHLWGLATTQPGYSKADWYNLQKAINKLEWKLGLR